MHLQIFPNVPKEWHDEALGAKWDTIRALRRVVTGAMELARNEKKIGSSLQAHPVFYLTEQYAGLLEGLDFAEICISSGMTYHLSPPAPDPFAELAQSDIFKLKDVPMCGAVVKLAEGHKCERCWKVLPEVGQNKSYPDLCWRCTDAVTHLRKDAA